MPKVKLSVKRRTPQDDLFQTVIMDEKYHHHYFWEPKGDFVFTTAERNVFFRVNSHIFFGRSMPLTKLAMESKGRVFQLKGTQHDWETLLGLFTNNEYALSAPTLREALSAFQLAYWYKMPVVRNWAEAHLRADFFYTPDGVREKFDNWHGFPTELTSYKAVFDIPAKMQLDPRITTLALYVAMLQREDENPKFEEKYPEQTVQIRMARQHLWKTHAWAMQELIQVPDTVFHAHGTLPCKAALVDWFPVDQPEDVLGTLSALAETEDPPAGCCEACQFAIKETVGHAQDLAWLYLPHCFGCWVPNVDQGWLLPNAAAQFIGTRACTI